MSSPSSGHDSSAVATATAPAPQPGGSGKFARRALLAAGGVVLCGGAAAATPYVVAQVTKATEAEIQAAFQAGASQARQDLINELLNLEGVSLTAAIDAAELTKLAVTYIVGPVSVFLVAIGAGALDVAISAIQLVLNGLSFIPNASGVAKPLKALQTMLTTWRDNLLQIPNDLTKYVTWDINSAETYLKVLQAKIEAEQSATTTPTPTP
jgi:hypothetical protein